MYNGIEAVEIKGTGLSGYVQRSKATMRLQVSTFRPVETGDAAEAINPLLAKRSQRENGDMARRLEIHQAIRAVKLKVFLYREDRLAGGAIADTVSRECQELHDSLMEVAMEEQRELKKREDTKSAERFAAAFGVKGDGAGGRAFDRAHQEEGKRISEQERRQTLEHQLAERVKKARHELEGHA